MAIFESLNPEPLYLNPESGTAGLFESYDDRRETRKTVDHTVDPMDLEAVSVDPLLPTVDNLAPQTESELEKSPESQFMEGALHNIGVNWETQDFERVGSSQFYEADIAKSASDPGKLSGTPVQAANVFGRKFSRMELEKDDEGRRLITLMEKARTGEHRKQGFWRGLFDFSDLSGSSKKIISDIPFIGWMVDGGATISETIAISRSMKKLQNGERISDHEALAVRRYMLQSQMESERGMGYNVGSLVHSSIPFMFEMAASGAMIAGATKFGAAFGTAITPVVGTAIGGAIGAVVGGALSFIFGGGRLLGKLAGKVTGKTMAKGAKYTVQKAMSELAARDMAKGAFTHGEAVAVRDTASKLLGRSKKEVAKAAFDRGRRKVLSEIGWESIASKIGRAVDEVKRVVSVDDAIKAAETSGVDRKVLRDRIRHESIRSMADSVKNVYDPGGLVDSVLAGKLLIGGDAELAVRNGYIGLLDELAIRRAGAKPEDFLKGDFFGFRRRKALQTGYAALFKDEQSLKAAKAGYANGLLGSVFGKDELKALDKGVLAAIDRATEGGYASDLINRSMASVLGNEAAVNRMASDKVLNRMLDSTFESLKMKYGVGGFAGNWHRMSRWLADGVLDGLYRWDTSIFGGLGTVARNGTTFGTKAAALSEALKVSFVEAPVRGAMQLGMQVPLWPVAAGVFGDDHDPNSFVVKGQLAIQARALQTGDKELMDHARAIAIGSGLVEYISENAGRGFNIFMSGIVKPTATALLPESSKKLGSWMARKMELVFGDEKSMISKNMDMIENSVKSRLQVMASGMDGVLPTVTDAEVRRLVTDRVATGGLKQMLDTAKMTPGRLIRSALNETVADSKLRAGVLYFVSYEMMRKGLTPQAMARFMERVGYDGVVSEMAEERYGGFFQGLLGLDDTASSSTWKDRLANAMKGLFPDKEQLITEALGFAIPSVSHISMAHLYNRLGQGVLSDIRRACEELNIGMNTTAEVVLSVDDPKYAQALQEYRDNLQKLRDAKWGSEADNRKAMTANAAALFQKIKDGKFTPTKFTKQFEGAQSVEEVEMLLSELGSSIVKDAGSDAGLESVLRHNNAVELFGEDGVKAIRGLAYAKQEFSGAEKTKFLESSEYRAAEDNVPMPSEASTSTVDNVINRIVVSMPVIGTDQSMLSAIKRKFAQSDTEKVRVNQYSDNMLDRFVDDAEKIADAMWRLEHGETGVKGWFNRGVMRLVGALDALVTGDLSLAARNPVQWALADQSLDRDLANTLLRLKKMSVVSGMKTALEDATKWDRLLTTVERARLAPHQARLRELDAIIAATEVSNPAVAAQSKEDRKNLQEVVQNIIREFSDRYSEKSLDDMDKASVAEFEKAGLEDFRSNLRQYMTRYLTAKNVLSVSRSDLDSAVSQVMRDRKDLEDTPENRIKVRHEIMRGIVKMASTGLIKVNTNARFTVTDATCAVIDYQRAMEHGTEKEIVAAIKSMPAFSSMLQVHDASGGRLITHENLSAFGRVGELDEFLAMPTDRDLDAGQLRRCMVLMGREFQFKSWAENQAAARRFLVQLHILAETNIPDTHVDGTGAPVAVTYEFSTDKDGNRVVAPTVWERRNPETGLPEGKGTKYAPCASLADAVRMLADVGVMAVRPNILFANRFTIASTDATSAFLTHIGSRERAYEYLVRAKVSPENMPPWCRKDPRTGTWVFDDFEEAMAQMRRELEVARSRSDSASAKAIRTKVIGAPKEDGTTDKTGYESAAEKYLETIGVTPVRVANEAGTLLGPGKRRWELRPSSLMSGGTWLITSDFNSSGESEAVLRTTIRSALHNAWMNPAMLGAGELSRDDMRNSFRAILELFDQSVETLRQSFMSRSPMLARRLEKMSESLGDSDWRNFEKLSAITSALYCFTCERGLGDAGNGFLFSPELAAVADEMRSNPVVLSFLDTVDRSLGGHGLVSDAGVQLDGIGRLVAAFSPSGQAISDSRTTSLFNRTGMDGAPKPGLLIPRVELGNTDLSANGVVASLKASASALMDYGGKTNVSSVEFILGRIAENVRAVATQYLHKVDSAGLTPADFHHMCLRASNVGGESMETRIRGKERAETVLKNRPGKTIRAGGTLLTVPGTPGARPKTTEHISPVDAIKLGRLLSHLITPDVVTGRSLDNPDAAAENAKGRSQYMSDMVRAMNRKLSLVDARRLTVHGRSGVETETVTKIRTYLQTRGMDPSDIDTVIENLESAFAGDSVVDVEDDPEGTVYDDVNDAVDDGANVESWMDDRKIRAAIEDKDLVALGRVLMHLFPKEQRNHMAIFCRLFTDLQTIVADVERNPPKSISAYELELFKSTVGYLNVLRSRDGKAIDAVVKADTWDDNDRVNHRLGNVVATLSKLGHFTYASVLDGLRRITDPVRRDKALRNIAYVASLNNEATYVTFEDGNVVIRAREAGTGAPGSVTAVRASYAHFVNGFLRGYRGRILAPDVLLRTATDADTGTSVDTKAILPTWQDALKVRRDKDGNLKKVSARASSLRQRFQQVLRGGTENDPNAGTRGIATKGPHVDAVRNAINFVEFGKPVSPEAHAAICRFARALAYRWSLVADLVDEYLGVGSDFSYALRSPGVVRQVIHDIERWITRDRAVDPGTGDLQTIESYREAAMKEFEEFLNTFYYSTFDHEFETENRETGEKYLTRYVCSMFHDNVLAPVIAISSDAVRLRKSEPAGVRKKPFRDYMMKAVAVGDMAEVGERARLRSSLRADQKLYTTRTGTTYGGINKPDERVAHAIPGKSISPIGYIFRVYEATMPRSIARVSGVSKRDQFGESGQAVTLPTSPVTMQQRLEDNLLAKLPAIRLDGSTVSSGRTLRDSYLSNGGFLDGSRLITISAGVSVDGSIEDRTFMSREVFKSNVYSYTKDRDTRSFKFMIYHGEKPAVNSVQLPGYVCEVLYQAILAATDADSPVDGVDGPSVMNPVLERLGPKLPRKKLSDIKSPLARRAAYDALYSVVAAATGCDEIDPKRTQVLLSQGTPFAGHSDVAYELRETKSESGKTRRRIETVRGEDAVKRAEGVENGSIKDGDGIVPATHFIISVSGATATANMGMYFAHGRLIDAQRGISTNPEAISFKNHLTDYDYTSLTKGQCHAIGLGIFEDEEVPMNGALLEAQRVQRREVERLLGLDKLGVENILDLPTQELLAREAAGDEEAKRHMDLRRMAVERVKTFFRFSSTISTDMETQKSGPFGNRCGLYAAKPTDVVTLRIAGKTFQMKADVNGENIQVSVDNGATWAPAPSGAAVPEYKNSAWPIALVVPMAMEVLGLSEIDEATAAGMISDWRDAKGRIHTGTLSHSSIFRGLQEARGERLSFGRNAAGGYVVRYATRNVVGQIMANADASSTSTNDHPAATNYVRDLIANQSFIRRFTAETSVASIVTCGRAMVHLVHRAYPEILEEMLDSDPDFANKSDRFPYSDTIREARARKINAALAKAMRINPDATHAVLVGSGIMAKNVIDRYGHRLSGEMDRSAGVTSYDVDALRPARLLRGDAVTAYRKLYGDDYAVDRTYASGMVNVDISDKGDPSFRYGWYLDTDKLSGNASVARILDHAKNNPAFVVTVDGKPKDPFTRYRDALAAANPGADQSELDAGATVATLMYVAHAEKGQMLTSILKDVFGACCTDYTGEYVGLSNGCNIERTAIDDLFIETKIPDPSGKGFIYGSEFDLLALDIGKYRRESKTSGKNGEKTTSIYIGGSFFSGDRRPSGNFESACGLARASAPVTRKASGEPGRTAMYILDPVQSAVQGSDTDGDSATLIKMHGVGHVRSIRSCVAEVFKYLDDDRKGGRKLKLRSSDARDHLMELARNPRFGKFFQVSKKKVNGSEVTVIDLSDTFHQELGNLLFQAQIDSYRMIETREQCPAAGEVAKTGYELADQSAEDLYDIGFSGRDPVGPDVVFDEKMDGPANAEARELYRMVTGEEATDGLKFNKAFKKCINVISEKAGIADKMDMLDPEQAAFLSASAADANKARGVMVALQATLEHLSGYARTDPAIRKMAPALFEPVLDDAGRVVYDPIRDFVAHLDGISNSLFDVVKDLFAPRCGWQSSMLNYLVARLLARANQDYENAVDKRTVRFGNSWFFTELVRFAVEFHSAPDSITGLLKRANAENNYLVNDTFGIRPVDGEKADSESYRKRTLTLRGLVADAAKDKDSMLSVLAGMARASVFRGRRADGIRNGEDNAQSGIDNLTEVVLKEVDNNFEDRMQKWLDDLGRLLSARDQNGAVTFRDGGLPSDIYDAAVAGALPPAMADVIDRLSKEPEVPGGPERGLYRAVDEFTVQLASVLTSANGSPIKGVSARDRLALSLHVLLGSSVDPADYEDRLSAASFAGKSLGRLKDMQTVNSVVSPEKQFRAGGSAADSLAVKLVDASKLVDPDDALLRVQMYVVGDRLLEIAYNQFDGEVLADRIAGDYATMRQALNPVAGQTSVQVDPYALSAVQTGGEVGKAEAAYNEFCRINSIEKFQTRDHIDVMNYVAALNRGSGATPVGQVSVNRRMMGPMLYTIQSAVDSGAYKSVGQFVGYAKRAWSVGFTRSYTHTKNARRRKEEEARRADTATFDEADIQYDAVDYDSASADVTRAGVAGSSALGALVERAIKNGKDASPYNAFLMSLNVTETTGAVKLESRLKPTAIAALRKSFESMKADRSAVPDIEVYEKVWNDEKKKFERRFVETHSGLRWCDVAWLLQLHLCSSHVFDSVQENDTKVDISCLFSDETMRRMQRYGVAAEHCFVTRALCKVGQTRTDVDGIRAYDLFREPRKSDRLPNDFRVDRLFQILERQNGMGTPSYSGWTRDDVKARVYDEVNHGAWTPIDIMARVVGDTFSSFHKALSTLKREETEKAQRLRSMGVPVVRPNDEFQVLTPFVRMSFSENDISVIDRLEELNESEAGFPFVGRPNPDSDVEDEREGRYQTIEGAMNSYGPALLESIKSDTSLPEEVRNSVEKLGTEDAGQAMVYRLLQHYTNRRQDPNNTYSFGNLARKILSDTRDLVGEAMFGEWVTNAMEKGGDYALAPQTLKSIRDAVEEIDRELNPDRYGEKPSGERASIELHGMPVSTEQVMLRSGLAKFLRESRPDAYQKLVTNPLSNLRFAFETAFGKFNRVRKTGAKVEQVMTKDGVAQALFKVTRYIKVREDGVLKDRVVTTYISYGENLTYDMSNELDVESFLDAFNKDADRKLTKEDLKNIPAEQLNILARAYGARKRGSSNTDASCGRGITTDALLALTGFVRLGSDADFHTVFHEYFHQMLDYCRNVGIVTAEDDAKLAKAFNSGGAFDEEAAANAFADFVDAASSGDLGRQKLNAAGLGGDTRKLFEKFRREMLALLAGATSFDVDGAPVFLTMLVTGDFSEREAERAEELTGDDIETIENILLSDTVAYEIPELEGRPIEQNYQKADGIAEHTRANVVSVAERLRGGNATVDDLKAALADCADAAGAPGSKPVFPAKTRPFGASAVAEESNEAPSSPKPVPAPTNRGRIVANTGLSRGIRLTALLEEALERFGAGDSMSKEELLAVKKLRDLVGCRNGDVPYDSVDLLVGLARRILDETCAALGINKDLWINEWLRGSLDREVQKAAPKTSTNKDGVTVNFTSADHMYWSDMPSGRIVYTSGTSFIGMYGAGFDRDAVAARSARRTGKTEEEVKKSWDDASTRGTMIHEVYEDVFSGRPVGVLPREGHEDEDRRLIKKAEARARKLMSIGTFVGAEVVVFDPDTMIAGSIDLVLRKPDGTYVLIDHKSNRERPTNDYAERNGRKMTGPLSHLPDGKLEKYRLQLNLYRELAVRTGVIPADAKVEMAINFFNGEDEEIIPVADMSREVGAMLQDAKDNPENLIPSGNDEGARERDARPGDANIVAELAVRLAHAVIGSSVRTDENGDPVPHERYAPGLYSEINHIVNESLASVAPHAWPAGAVRLAGNAGVRLSDAANELRAKADVMFAPVDGDDKAETSRKADGYADMLRKADDLDRRADRLNDLVMRLCRGENVDKFLTGAEATAGADLYDSLFRAVTGGVKMKVADSGAVTYERAEPGAMDLSSKFAQEACDLVAQALGAAVAISRFVVENGVELPMIGSVPSLPTEDAAIPMEPVKSMPKARPSVNNEGMPDTTPQMVLQSQTSWLLSDMQRQFLGVNLRDVMTNTSWQALVEESNRLANRINFYFGADVGITGRPRKISLQESDMALADNGLFEVDREHRHTTLKAAAVRGYMLGIVTRAAETAGDEDFDFNDVNMVNFALQAAGCVASSDEVVLTDFELPVIDRERLTEISERDPVSATGYAMSKPVAELVATGSGYYNVINVVNRAKGRVKGGGEGKERASGLDILLERVAAGLPSEITGCVRDKEGHFTGEVRPGLYSIILRTYATSLDMAGKHVDPGQLRAAVAKRLSDSGHVVFDNTRRPVISIPVENVNDTWMASNAVRKLVAAGRRKGLLDLYYVGQVLGMDAANLNRVAGQSQFLTDDIGGAVSGHGAAGLWFEAGSGHHSLVVQRYVNSLKSMGVEPNIDEVLKNKLRSFTITMEHDNVQKGANMWVTGQVRGDRPAFERRVDPKTGKRTNDYVNLTTDRLQNLMHLLGLGARANKEAIDEFVVQVERGVYSMANPDNVTGVDIRSDMTVFELDKAIYKLECALVLEEDLTAEEGTTVLTRPESDGGFGFKKNELVTLNEVLRRTGMKMLFDQDSERKLSGSVNSLSEVEMFRKFGRQGTAKTGPERLRSMAESIVAAERFRGCLVQMLTSVGSDGSPNYIVSPTEGAANLAPDAFWGALARFVAGKFSGYSKTRFQYDSSKTGIENMRDVAAKVNEALAANDGGTKTDKFRRKWHVLPPSDIGAHRMFDNMLVLSDRPDDDTSVLNDLRTVGGEAAGYMKQLFGAVRSPSVWHGWKIVDRLMSYSKAMSVGMSAFFTFATRFESPVAACGLMNTLPGYWKKTSGLARKASAKANDLVQALENTGFGRNFAEALKAAGIGVDGLGAKMPYLADFMEAVTSDDPAIRDMRELCHLTGFPLSDPIRNPMNDAGGHIDNDIKRIVGLLRAQGHYKWAKEVEGFLKAALQNPGEYTFANVLNCVQMAVVAQTMYRLRRECESGNRPFDPVRELRRLSPYIATEIGGITPERYAWLTPAMQRILRMTMFSWMWTMSAWTAGCGEVVTDALFGGHGTNSATRRYAFVRWMRMLGIVKVGVPVCLQAVIRGLASMLQRTGIVGDPDDDEDKDPLGIENMPWLCFFNESKVGALAFDVTPILRLSGRIRSGSDEFLKKNIPGYRDYIAPAVPWITSAATAATTGIITRSVGGAAIGAVVGASAPSLTPNHTGVGHGRNTSGNRRYYMHFGKQSDEFWRWFTDPWSQATSKLAPLLQKTMEAMFGSVGGGEFAKEFATRGLVDRFIGGGLDPEQNALVNWFTSFMPFSAASLASHPDAGVMAMFAPVQMGESRTGLQKRITRRLLDFAMTEGGTDVYASPKFKKNLSLLCADVISEARLNGMDPAEVLNSGIGTVSTDLYAALADEVPKTFGDSVDGDRVAAILRAMRRLRLKSKQIMQSLAKKYKSANVDWETQRGRPMKTAVRSFLSLTARDPWATDDQFDLAFRRVVEHYDRRRTQQADRGGDGLSNFLATDDVPPTLFGVPIVADGYTEYDLEFFRRNPEAGGFYDMGGEPGDAGPAAPEGADDAQ